eukprot:366271-Chlamydomonas_euryale.AAC.4
MTAQWLHLAAHWLDNDRSVVAPARSLVGQWAGTLSAALCLLRIVCGTLFVAHCLPSLSPAHLHPPTVPLPPPPHPRVSPQPNPPVASFPLPPLPRSVVCAAQVIDVRSCGAGAPTLTLMSADGDTREVGPRDAADAGGEHTDKGGGNSEGGGRDGGSETGGGQSGGSGGVLSSAALRFESGKDVEVLVEVDGDFGGGGDVRLVAVVGGGG